MILSENNTEIYWQEIKKKKTNKINPRSILTLRKEQQSWSPGLGGDRSPPGILPAVSSTAPRCCWLPAAPPPAWRCCPAEWRVQPPSWAHTWTCREVAEKKQHKSFCSFWCRSVVEIPRNTQKPRDKKKPSAFVITSSKYIHLLCRSHEKYLVTIVIIINLCSPSNNFLSCC